MSLYTYLKFATLSLIVVLFLSANISYAQTTGSIEGKVIDAKDNSPLIGATVKIDGKALGAATDENGTYVILNVDVGEYTVTASYVGYDDQKQTGIRVSVDQKTKVNFGLTVSGVTTEVITIEGVRKGIDVEQSGRLIDKQQIENSGIKNLNTIVSKTAGVVTDERGGSINIRGGRSSENLIIVDGVATSNPLDGSSTGFVSTSLIQEISVLTGGFGAEYGNALSGIINVSTRGGSDRYTGNLEAVSDFAAGKWIGSQSYGYNLYNFSFGGPLIPVKSLSRVINFYGGVERQYLQDQGPSWIADKITSDGILPANWKKLWSTNVRLTIDFSQMNNGKGAPLTFKSGMNITNDLYRTLGTSNVNLLYNVERTRITQADDYQFYGRIVHNVSNKFFYELQGNYYKTKSEFGDPLFFNNIFLYGDIATNPGLRQQGAGTLGRDATGLFNLPGSINDSYRKTDVSYFGGKLDATYALITKNTGNHEIKFGGEYRYNTLRKLQLFPSAVSGQSIDLNGGLSNPPASLWISGSGARLRSYGYDVVDQFGNQIISTSDAQPKHPIIGAFYIRDKADFSDFTFNGGIRIDYLDVNDLVLNDKNIIRTPGSSGDVLTPDLYSQSKANISVSPRLGFSFPVTDKTIFVAQYGKFVQLPTLDQLYLSRDAFAQFFAASVQDIAENPSLKPEKLTSYEVGIKQQVGDYVNMGVTAYYKETKDQIGASRVFASETVPQGYTIYDNVDFSVSRGLDFYLSLRRMNRLAVDISYTLLYASGTGSSPNTNVGLINGSFDLPNFTYPLNYDQRHTGSVNLDYRFGGDEDVPHNFMGQVLKNMGLNMLFSFNSGRPYTKRNLPGAPLGSGSAISGPNQVYSNWNLLLDAKLDKTFSIWKTNMNAYIYITNLLNTEIINNVYESTGLPGDDGFLTTPQVSNHTPEYANGYRIRLSNYTNWGAPRQVRFGLKLNF